MSTYQELRGLKVKYLAANPDPGTAGDVWYDSATFELKGFVGRAAASSGALMTTARRTGISFGTQTANVAAGGWIPAFSAKTEEYNGSGWSAGEDLGTAAAFQFGAGTSTAGLAYGGSVDPNGQEGVVTTLEYDGTDWTAGGDLNQARWSSTAGAGTQTAALCASGYHDSNVTNTEEYNGSAWTAGEAIDAGKRDFGQCGTLTASILFGGTPGLATTELYDGTDYSSGPSMNTGRSNPAASGTQTAALGMGGYKDPGYANNVELYDGTSWSEFGGNLTTARDGSFGSRGGTVLAALIAGGSTPSLTTATEEYNSTFEVVTQGTWASGGNLNTARRSFAGGAGTGTAGMIAGGYIGPFSNATEEYDGSAWANGGNYPAALYYVAIGGTQTAGIGVTGGDPVISEACEYDGSSWTDVGNAPISRKMMGRAGTQTASLFAGGNDGPNQGQSEAFTYDGTNFTDITDMPDNRGSGNINGGSQTDALMASGAGGSPPQSVVDTTDEWNGSSWAAGGTCLLATQSSCNANSPSGSDHLTIGGYTAGARIANCFNYDGTTWFTSPSLPAAREQMGGCGTPTAAVAAGGSTGSAVNTTTEYTGPFVTETGSTIDFD